MKDQFHDYYIRKPLEAKLLQFVYDEKTEKLFNDNKIRVKLKKGDVFKLTKDVKLEPYSAINSGNVLTTLGAFSYSNSLLPWGGALGRYCSIAKGLEIFGAEHFVDWISTSPRFYTNEHQSQIDASQITHKKRESRCVNIGHDVWIGSNVTLKKCITIGDGAIVGAGSIVTHDVEPFSVVAGVPAKHIKWRFKEEIIKRIQRIQWWKYHIDDLRYMHAENPLEFLDQLEKKISANRIEPFLPSGIDISHISNLNPFYCYAKIILNKFNILIADDDYSKSHYRIFVKGIDKNIHFELRLIDDKLCLCLDFEHDRLVSNESVKNFVYGLNSAGNFGIDHSINKITVFTTINKSDCLDKFMLLFAGLCRSSNSFMAR